MTEQTRSGWSIRRRLLIMVVAVSTPFVVLYAFSSKMALHRVIADTQATSQQLALLLARDIEQFIEEQRRMLISLAQRPAMRVEHPAQCDAVFSDFLVLHPSFANLTMSDRVGHVVCSAVPLRDPDAASVAALPVFKTMIATGLFTISEPFIGPMTGKQVTSLMQPRRDKQGRLLGGIGLPVDLVRFERQLAAVRLEPHTVITLVSASGIVLTRTGDAQYWAGRDISRHDLARPLFERDEGQIVAHDIDGQERYIAFARVPSTGWRVYVGKSAASIHAQADLLMQADLQVGVLILLLVLGVALYGSRGIERPVHALEDTVRQLAAGAEQQRAAVQGPREIAAVAAAFNALLDQRDAAKQLMSYQCARTQQYLDIAGVMFGVLDKDGRITMMNRKGCEVLGYTEQELLGQDWFTCCLPPEKVRALRRVFDRIIRGEITDIDYYEYPVLTKSGERRVLAFHTAVLRNIEGDIDGVLFSAEDITQRKRAEQALQHTNEGLEQRILDRTRQLDLANQELEAFSYSVSHDLRAPLRSIEGFSQALLEDYDDRLNAEGQDFLRRICRSCQRMNTLIDDLLTLSRATSTELHRRECDLGALSEELMAELRSAEPGRTLTFSVAPELRVHGDPELLRIALGNLLANAWKFTRRSSATNIEVGMLRDQGRNVYFVSDNGVGFDMQNAEQLFVPFQRFHHVDEFEGTGIGLAIVQRIVRRHGGTVWAQAQPGAGATFYFTLEA